MKKTIVTFNRDKETKNAIRFTAMEGSAIAGSLYVSKEAAGDAQAVSVTVEVAAI